MDDGQGAAPAGRERGQGTRERMLEAAVEVFGRLGYDGASTRALAAAAGVNLAAIPYHFGGKEGLYLASAAHIAGRLAERLSPVLARTGGRLAELERGGRTAGPAECGALLAELLADFSAFIVRPEADPWAAFIFREQMTPTRAFEVLYDGFMGRFLGMVTRLLAACPAPPGLPADEAGVRLRAFSLIGQALVFRVGRAAVMRTLGWPAIGPAELAQVRAAVRAGVAAVVGAGHEPGQGDDGRAGGDSPRCGATEGKPQ